MLFFRAGERLAFQPAFIAFPGSSEMERNTKFALNPYLPLDVCIADGEPHVFGDRIYILGSHDRPGGETFCELDYELWSAPTDDLGNWTSHGIIYSATQDPGYSGRKPYLFAPDVARGNDGRFYLYYSLGGWRGKHGYEGPISVAVCDRPDGKYEYLGFVRNSDGTPFQKRILFDPAVINDEGVIRLYFGTSYFFDEYKCFPTRILFQYIESKVFDRSFRQIQEAKENLTGAYTVQLADDMLTVISEPRLVVPARTAGTPFAGHAFFEAASIRKLKERYYFIYSSRNNHELCYAVSDRPDEGFVYGGPIISNGDIGYRGRKPGDRLNLTGNNHGGIVEIGGKTYIFYHRMTDKSTYSRQACAEEISIEQEGRIEQVEMSCCGLNGGPLPAQGGYPAAMACVLTNGHMPHLTNGKLNKKLPCITWRDGQAVIADIKNETVVGYRSFRFAGGERLSLKLRGDFHGTVRVLTEPSGEAETDIQVTPLQETLVSDPMKLNGIWPIYLDFHGHGTAVLQEIRFM
jgi:hypothetical protein